MKSRSANICWAFYGFCTTLRIESAASDKGMYGEADYHCLGDMVPDVKAIIISMEAVLSSGILGVDTD